MRNYEPFIGGCKWRLSTSAGSLATAGSGAAGPAIQNCSWMTIPMFSHVEQGPSWTK